MNSHFDNITFINKDTPTSANEIKNQIKLDSIAGDPLKKNNS